MEIDLELLDMLIQNAYTVDYWSAVNNQQVNATNTGFDQTSATTGGYYNTQGGWFQTLGTKLQKVSNKIHQLTLRGGANFMVVSPPVSSLSAFRSRCISTGSSFTSGSFRSVSRPR